MEIRLIKAEEREECLSLMASCFDKSIQSIFFLYPESTLVAVIDERIVGGINMHIYPVKKGKFKVGYIGWVYVSKEARGQGVAKVLFDEAILFMKEEGCSDIALCIEGDNPSSFRSVSSRSGFGIISLFSQFKRFGTSTFTIWKNASRFFDMGYFLWHYKEKDSNSLNPSKRKELSALLITILLNTLLFLPKLIYFPSSPLYLLLIPALVLICRSALLLIGGNKIFLPWDSSYLSSLIFAFTPIAFPSPGGVYIRGSNWTLDKESKALAISSLFAVTMEIVLAFIFRNYLIALSFIIPLILLDSFFFFYPFCGFLASRIKRGVKGGYPLFVSIVLLSLTLLFFMH